MSPDDKKKLAAQAALDYVIPGSIVGVGTGSTVNHFIKLLAEQMSGKIEATVSSSQASTALLQKHGFRVEDLNTVGHLSIYVDGADESNSRLHLIKGGGGALTREKIIAQSSDQFVCIADDSKLVDTLGAFPLPIEVIPMARVMISRQLETTGGSPRWREDFVTDNGNHILDLHDLSIDDPIALETQINQMAGVVTVGLFAHRPADVLILGGDQGVRTLTA